MTDISRRQLLQQSGFTLVGSLVTSGISNAFADETTVSQSATAATILDKAGISENSDAAATIKRFNRYPRIVHDYYVHRVRAVEQSANARRAALKTKAEAERYVADVRERLLKCFGPFPARSPLNPIVTAVHEREGFKIENVIYESRPGFYVTANLYVPMGRKAPMPGVLGACGHSDTGKAGGSYQMFAQGLVRQGYVTLIFDPIGQGERIQHVDNDFKPLFGKGTSEHTYIGNRMPLVGENLPTWFAWDSIRSLDYLLSRPEVDPKHIGATGNSGGGTQTTWLCAVDRRVTMAAPSCFVTTIRRNIENEHPSDPEQYPWRLLDLELDHSDCLAAMAPNPLMLLGQEKDYFDARGFEEASLRLQNLYRLLGAEQNFASFLGADTHGFSRPNREAMYGWFNRQTRIAKGQEEPEIKLERNSVLTCTKSGQVAELNGTTEFSTNSAKARELNTLRGIVSGEALRQAILDCLKMPKREGVADYRILRPVGGRGYPKRNAGSYAVETEPGICALVYRLSDSPLTSRVPKGFKRALLYVAHQSADAELREDEWLKELIQSEPRTAIFACDVRGVGESKPALSTPEPPAKGGIDYFHAGLGLMFDYPTPGQRTFDVLRVVDWLRENGHEQIHLVARGWGAIPGTFAAVLSDSVTQVTLMQALTSYSDLTQSEQYRWPLATLVPNVLNAFDLTDCYRELEQKSLNQIEPASALGVPMETDKLT